MRTVINLIVLGVFVCLSNVVMAQDEKESYIYVTYFTCDVTQQDRADEIVDKVDKPIYDAAVEDGIIDGWGWLAHHTGGKWRRARYHSAGSVEELIAALDTIGEQQDEQDEADEFGKICNSHDDYIWRGVTGSGGDMLATARGKVGLSAYYVCDSRESAADEIVQSVFAPVYDEHIGEGKLTSWGWAEHIVGGKYRRLATMTAENWPSLFAARASIIEAGDDSELGRQFGEICDSHADYLWEIRYENP
jgi:hypothetical protein